MHSDTSTLSGVTRIGPAPHESAATVVMVHGRNATAESILSLFPLLNASRCTALAPDAPGGSWYPHSFLAPIVENEPHLSRSLARIDGIISAITAEGVPPERIALLGFSQGACLVLEYTARHPQRYGGVMALTGGLIGPPGTPRNYPGELFGTPVFIGTSDPDPHVPRARVEESRDVLQGMGAVVELRIYPGMAHTINEDEIAGCRALLQEIVNHAP